MSKDWQITVYTTTTNIPPGWREERRNAQEQTLKLAKPVRGIVCADVDSGGLAIGKLWTFFKSLPKSNKVGDPDILTAFARAVRSARDACDQSEGSRTQLFMFLSYVAVVATKIHGPELEALEDAMQKALGKSNGEPMALDYLKSLRTGVLNLHRVINGLVAKGWLPAHATSTVVSRESAHTEADNHLRQTGAYLRYYQYGNLKGTHIDAIVDELLKNPRTDDKGGGRDYTICVAAELAKLDSQLRCVRGRIFKELSDTSSRDTTHKDLHYEFECATCRSSDRMDINVLLD